MKKRNGCLSFFGGILITLLVCACVTTVFAASGAVKFNVANLYLDGMKFCEEGENLQTATGASIPSSILYTDEQGGSTTYIPVRNLANALHLPIEWTGDGRVILSLDDELGLYALPFYRSGSGITINNSFKEVDAITEHSGTAVLPQTALKTEEAFEKDLPLSAKNGRYISVTVTNHASKPVQFDLGLRQKEEQALTALPSQVPAGETVTRTMEIILPEGSAFDPLYVFVGYRGHFSMPLDVTISAVQFDK